LLFRRGGVRLAVGGFFLQQLYYLYSVFGLAMGSAIYFVRSFSRHPDQPLKQA
jgi:hypothetical protein